jgi:hypothetical protein
MFKLSGDPLIENGVIRDKINIRVINISIIEDVGDLFMIKQLRQSERIPIKKRLLSEIEYKHFWFLDKQLSNKSRAQSMKWTDVDYELYPIEAHWEDVQSIVKLIVSFLTNPLDHQPEGSIFIFERSIVKDLNGQWWAYQD